MGLSLKSLIVLLSVSSSGFNICVVRVVPISPLSEKEGYLLTSGEMGIGLFSNINRRQSGTVTPSNAQGNIVGESDNRAANES
jgi:hypothetical protein